MKYHFRELFKHFLIILDEQLNEEDTNVLLLNA